MRLRPPKRDITARMLMLHTAGFGYDFANPIIRRLLDENRLTPHRSATVAGFRQPLVNEPGERWEYGLSIDWLGLVIEADRAGEARRDPENLRAGTARHERDRASALRRVAHAAGRDAPARAGRAA